MNDIDLTRKAFQRVRFHVYLLRNPKNTLYWDKNRCLNVTVTYAQVTADSSRPIQSNPTSQD